MTAAKADGAELTAEQLADREEDERQQRADRKLLAEALKWARVNGYVHERVYEMGYFSGYGWDVPCGRVHFCPLHDPVIYYSGSAIQPGSAREAVDVLCALGVLPAHLSSAWQAAQKELKARINRLERQVIVTMAEMPMNCRYHGSDFDFLGREYPGGPPRCDSCKQPWRLRQLLAAAGGVMPE